MSLEWKDVVLKDVLSEKGYIRGPFGSALKRSEMKSEGIPVYEQQNAIYDNRIFRYYIDDEKYQSLKRFTTLPNDLIISCSGTVGKVSIIKENDPKGIISQALLTLRVNNELIHPEFLKYFFTSYEGYNSLVSRSTGSVQVNISKRAVIEEIPIKLPPLAIQDKIVYYLRLIDKKIEVNEKINKNLEELSLSLAIHIFKNNNDETIELKEICKFIKGRKPTEISEFKENNFMNYLTIDVLTNQDNMYAFDKRGINANEYDILMVMDGASSGKLFYGKNGLVGSTLAKLETDKKYQEIIYQFLKINEPFICENTTGTAIPHTDKGLVLNLQCPMSEAILEFSETFKTIRSTIISNTNEINGLQNLRDTLLPKLMSGEIDVSKINCYL